MIQSAAQRARPGNVVPSGSAANVSGGHRLGDIGAVPPPPRRPAETNTGVKPTGGRPPRRRRSREQPAGASRRVGGGGAHPTAKRGGGGFPLLPTPDLLRWDAPVTLALLLGDAPPPLIAAIAAPRRLGLPPIASLAPAPAASTGDRVRVVGRAAATLVGGGAATALTRLPAVDELAWGGMSTFPRRVDGVAEVVETSEEEEVDDAGHSDDLDAAVEAPPEDAEAPLPGDRRERAWPGMAAAMAASLGARGDERTWRPHLDRPLAASRRPPAGPHHHASPWRGGSAAGTRRRGPDRTCRPSLTSPVPISPVTPDKADGGDSSQPHGRGPAAPGSAAAATAAAAAASAAAVSTAAAAAAGDGLQDRTPAAATAAAARAAAIARFREKKRRGDFSSTTRYVRRAVESTRRARLGGRFVSREEYERRTGAAQGSQGGEEEEG